MLKLSGSYLLLRNHTFEDVGESKMSRFSADMLSLLDRPEGADVTFSVESGGHVEQIKAHKTILVVRSAYFRALFDSRLKESLAGEIRIKEAPALFREALKFIYSGLPPKNIDEIALSLLPLADKYGLDELRKSCVKAIRQSVSEENVIDVILLAENLRLPALLRYCVPVFRAHAETLEKGSHWGKLKRNPDLLAKLLVFCCKC